LPLLKRARIEIYLPVNAKKPGYMRLQKAFEQEFLETFGGATVINDIKGLYFSAADEPIQDKINLVYTDTPFDFDEQFTALSTYTDALREVALEASDEESILIVVHQIYHSI
jgi:DNA-directed RNA polymerase delta subunit